MRSAPQRRCSRSRITSARFAGGVAFGDRLGRLERSCRPASPSAANLSRHLRTVFASTWNCLAAALTVHR